LIGLDRCDPRTVKKQPMASEDPKLEKALQMRGLRHTRARAVILSLLAERHDHPTAEQIAEELRERGERIGVATIYQNLNKLAENNVIGRIKGPDGLMHFDTNTAPHHHLVCQRCGRIVDAEIERLLPAMGLPRCPHTGEPLYDWSLQGVQIELKGICPTCR